MKVKCKRVRASVTVEAVFLVPFILAVILAVVILVFMLYDRMKMAGDINFLLEHAKESKQMQGIIDPEELKEYWHKLSDGGYLFCTASEPVIDISGDEISITADIEMIAPIGRLCERLVRSFGVMTVRGSINVTGREKIMRLMDAGKEIVNAD